jgi:hypothetical protein
MRFICGVCKDGYRRIFSAENAPTVKNLDDLTEQIPVDSYDWGQDADFTSSERTARIILSVVTDRTEAARLASLYAEQVVRVSLSTDRMWMLPVQDIRQWVEDHRMVA